MTFGYNENARHGVDQVLQYKWLGKNGMVKRAAVKIAKATKQAKMASKMAPEEI